MLSESGGRRPPGIRRTSRRPRKLVTAAGWWYTALTRKLPWPGRFHRGDVHFCKELCHLYPHSMQPCRCANGLKSFNPVVQPEEGSEGSAESPRRGTGFGFGGSAPLFTVPFSLWWGRACYIFISRGLLGQQIMLTVHLRNFLGHALIA